MIDEKQVRLDLEEMSWFESVGESSDGKYVAQLQISLLDAIHNKLDNRSLIKKVLGSPDKHELLPRSISRSVDEYLNGSIDRNEMAGIIDSYQGHYTEIFRNKGIDVDLNKYQ